ncbi:MAG: PAS domain S-box protein [Euryarchaeota archaeon]|nr:PAS domain S-box protein [Euryarchaeota archaeon]MBU4608882.1 PAS domain S-box protein [Euryarchaeota archaeon]MBV1730442.1 PAS domain S-box protein [Methanobacterium sp.]MBV1754613.1 PAS domain S-box protein [Methanobacterium sp.]
MPSDDYQEWDTLREKIIGLGEHSIQKSYYPKLQEQLKELERFKTLLDHSNDAIFLIEVVSGKLMDLNQSAYNQLNYEYSDIIKRSIWDLIISKDHSEFKKIFTISNRAQDESKWTLETQFLKKDGSVIPMEVSLSLVIFSGEKYSVMVARDIKERLIAKEALKKSEDYYRAIFENSSAGMIILEKDTTISLANSEVESITNYPRREIEGRKTIKYFLSPDNLEDITGIHKTPVGESVKEEYETDIIDRYGNKKHVFITLAPIPRTDKHLASILDITDRKKAEEKIKNSLKEKEVLLQEIHHRVKNNLQIISSLLNLQTSNIRDPLDLEIFQESQDRIKSMALIHEQLYRSRDLASINFAIYIQQIMSHLFYSYTFKDKNIKLKLELEDINLEIDTAIPCGLIINEVVSNCLKHAFKGKNSGEIKIVFKEEKGLHHLTISDNGIGFPLKKMEKSTSLGLKLVQMLVDQIEGELEIDSKMEVNNSGTSFYIKFQELQYKKRI